MKKVISIVMAMALLLATFVSCGGSAITGKWTAVYGDMGGMKVKMTADSFEMGLEIKADGTAIGTTGDSVESKMKWKEEKGVYKFTGEGVGEEATGKLENGVLVLDYNGIKNYMSKDP
ncbi:MAG: hypothetical protein Q4A41_02045, partial [Bacillota bacterium]|nr:hypothetical protein [Bacillota bacterium]